MGKQWKQWQNNWCFWTVVLEKTLENPLGCKEIKPVNPKGNQPWISIGGTGAKAEVPIRWPLDVKSSLTGKDSRAGKDWEQEKRATVGDRVILPHRLNGHEFEQILGDSEGQRSLVCCGVGKNWTWLSDWRTQMETVNRSVGWRRDK